MKCTSFEEQKGTRYIRKTVILAKNFNFKKLTHGFVDERALIATTLISSCHWKILVPFWLRKKRPEKI